MDENSTVGSKEGDSKMDESRRFGQDRGRPSPRPCLRP